jgi:hypothetical protein
MIHSFLFVAGGDFIQYEPNHRGPGSAAGIDSVRSFLRFPCIAARNLRR